MAYGTDRMLVQAMPTPIMDTYSIHGSVMKATDSRPSPPAVRQSMWVSLRPTLRATAGSNKLNAAETPLYTANATPTKLAPSLKAADFGSVVW